MSDSDLPPHVPRHDFGPRRVLPDIPFDTPSISYPDEPVTRWPRPYAKGRHPNSEFGFILHPDTADLHMIHARCKVISPKVGDLAEATSWACRHRCSPESTGPERVA